MLDVLSIVVQHSQNKNWVITPKDLAILECVSQATKTFIVDEQIWSLTYYPTYKIRTSNMKHLAYLKARGVNFDRDVTVANHDHVMYYIHPDDGDEPYVLTMTRDELRGIKEIFPDACIELRGVFSMEFKAPAYKVFEEALHFIDNIMKSYDITKEILTIRAPCRRSLDPNHESNFFYQWIPGSPPSLDQRIRGVPPADWDTTICR